MQNILRFFIISLFCLIGIYSVNAQVSKQKTDTVVKTAFRGLVLEIDLASIASNFIYKGELYGYEAGISANLKQKYFPTIEIGFAGANKTSIDALNFKTSGLYGRLGVDFNLIKPKKDKEPTHNIFFAGARIGFSPFSYSYKNAVVENNYWGTQISQNYNDITTTKVWIEVVAGMRVEVLKNIYMGWTVRNKKLLGTDILGEIDPYYIPGFGKKSDGGNWGVNYAIGYKF